MTSKRLLGGLQLLQFPGQPFQWLLLLHSKKNIQQNLMLQIFNFKKLYIRKEYCSSITSKLGLKLSHSIASFSLSVGELLLDCNGVASAAGTQRCPGVIYRRQSRDNGHVL